MKIAGRWLLALAALAVCGWVVFRSLPGARPAPLGEPSVSVHRGSPADTVARLPLATAKLASAEPDWAARFHAAASNDFDLVASAARAAYAGDGAAQYYIGRTLARCEETNQLYRDADDAEQAVSHLASAPALLELERQEYLNCRRFRDENPFKALPARADGYPADYWRARALAGGYPVAVVAAALESVDSQTPKAVSGALASGNPEAMLLFGWSRATENGTTEATKVIDAAWVLAACDSGADCGPANDVLPATYCAAGVELGCTQRYSIVDELTASLSRENLDEARLLARNIRVDMRYHDPDRLEKYLPF